MEKDFLRGHVVAGEGAIVLNWKRTDLHKEEIFYNEHGKTWEQVV